MNAAQSCGSSIGEDILHLLTLSDCNSVMALVITCFSLCVCSLHIQNADTVDGNAGAMSLIAMDIWSRSCGFLLLHLGRRHQHLLRQITRNQHCGVHMEEQDMCSGHGLTLVQSPFSGQAPHRHEPVIFAVGS